ncbi:type II toxin-antitoxin system HicA family toxin [Rhodothermus marinus]
MVPDTVSPQCLKLLKKARQKPGNFDFKELCRLVECFGFEFAREKGSHRIYRLSEGIGPGREGGSASGRAGGGLCAERAARRVGAAAVPMATGGPDADRSN